MMNKKLDFPIAFCFGDRDFLGSDGADRIVKNNKHFKSGRSYLFKLSNSGHNLFLDNPESLCEMMIGFYKGTIKGTFDPKPRKEFTPPVSL